MQERTGAGQQIGQPISHDDFYYRDDIGTIDEIVKKGSRWQCRIFLGLRRFGKSSFLRRIERFCNGSNDEWNPEMARAGYQHAKAYFVECNKPMGMPEQINRGLDDKPAGVELKIFLLDDLQGYAAAFNDADESIPDIDDALTRLFKAAEARPTEVRIVLAEPTNHIEWLETDSAGKQIRRVCGRQIANVAGYIPSLRPDQSAALLTGSPLGAGGKSERRYELSEKQTSTLHSAFGGNPWFLAYAYDQIDQSGDTSALDDTRIESFILNVNRTIDKDKGDGERGLMSIYNALSAQEKFIVDLLVDRWYIDDTGQFEAASAAGRESITLFSDGAEHYWHADAREVHVRLHTLGLISIGNRVATGLTSKVFAEHVHKKIKDNKAILDDPGGIDEDMWSQLISSKSPAERLRSRCVIHQFSDLFFDDSQYGHDYWQRYVDWIGDEKKKKDSENAPHFIVVCGNIIPGEDEGAGENASDEYRKRLKRALETLRLAVKHLKQVKGNAPTNDQIILVPGVLDIDWPAVGTQTPKDRKETLDNFYSKHKAWNELVEQIGFSVAQTVDYKPDPKGPTIRAPKVINFPIQRVSFVPFDTADVTAVREEIGDRAALDIIDIRRRLRTKFVNDWTAMRNKGSEQPKKAEERLRNFFGATWRYVFDEADPEASHAGVEDDAVDTHTFRWSTYRAPDPKSKNAEPVPQNWVSEAGFISESTRLALSDMPSSPETPDMARIAVMHHAPRQLRRSTLVAFYQSFKLRQLLMKAGINWVLHGNSVLQQRAEELVMHFGKRDPKSADGTQGITMVSAGSFSSMSDYIPPAFRKSAEEELPARPSFNQISIIPRDRKEGAKPDQRAFSVDVKFWQWPSKEAREPETR